MGLKTDQLQKKFYFQCPNCGEYVFEFLGTDSKCPKCNNPSLRLLDQQHPDVDPFQSCHRMSERGEKVVSIDAVRVMANLNPENGGDPLLSWLKAEGSCNGWGYIIVDGTVWSRMIPISEIWLG